MSNRFLFLSTVIMAVFITGFPLLGKEVDPKEFLKKTIKKTVEIDDIFANPKLNVDESRLYVCDKQYRKIHIFSKATGEKINTCGSQGEGPEQFIVVSGINLTKDAIYVTSPGKLSVFSKDGKLKNEIHDISRSKEFIPFGQNYLGSRFDYDDKGNTFLVYTLFDKNLKKLKDVFNCPYKMLKGTDKNKEAWIFFRECQKAVIYKDRLYIGISDLGFFFAVFDSSGNKLYDIKIDYDKIPIPASSKDQILNKIKISEGDNWERFKQTREVVFPEYMPSFVNFFIYNHSIYVFKYPAPGSKGWSELILLDLKGKIIKSLMLPLQDFFMRLESPDSISYFDGKVYFLSYSEEKIILKEFSLDKL